MKALAVQGVGLRVALLLLCWVATAASLPSSLPQFGMGQWTVQVPSGYTNSFNTSQLGTWVTFTGPNGVPSIVSRPFWTSDYVRTISSNGSELLTPTGAPPYFAVRMSPTVQGTWTYQQMFDGGSAPPEILPINGSFLCTAPVPLPSGQIDGYATVHPTYKQYFTLQGGPGVAPSNTTAAFWLVGENMGWPGVWPYFNGSSAYSNGTGGTYMYDRYLSKLAAAGGNWIRLWIGPSLAQEPVYDGEQGSFLDLALMGQVSFGSYNLQAAWRIDYIVELARTLGVKITLVFDAQQGCCEPGVWCFFNQSTYSTATGGPLDDCTQVWTDPRTRAEFQQRWRYILARWAYATSIFSWELANENDDWAGWGPAAIQAQLSMAALLAAEDAYEHIIDDSFARPDTPVPDIEGSSMIGFTSAHGYGAPDTAKLVWQYVPARVAAFGKPSFIQEFGASWKGPYQHQLDPTGIALHNGAWASLAGLAAGTAMQWWWNEVDALDTYAQLSGAAVFSRSVAPILTVYNWSTWSNATGPGHGAGGGWIVGRDSAGTPAAMLVWLYNLNHTWSNMGQGGVLYPITGATLTLHGLGEHWRDLQPTVLWINTTTGQPLPSEEDAGCTAACFLPVPLRDGGSAGDVVLTAPTFLTDVAALVTLPPQQPQWSESEGGKHRSRPIDIVYGRREHS